jgi:photosystem II stability/assembly factor-like uncharacterized protein
MFKLIKSKNLSMLLGATILATGFVVADGAMAQKKSNKDASIKPVAGQVFGGIKLRNLGPALTSGRISDFAMTPGKFNRYFVATASGGLWLTENNGSSWKPVFDKYGSYSIGVVEIDSNNNDVVWVGTGENNSQRSVAYGDGVYKSIDGGKSFKNMGLKNSEHISQIVIDPRDSDTVFVAAQGPLWNKGGDRGLYKTTDGGKTWEASLTIDEHTGVNEVVMNPENPDVMILSSYQRARTIFTLVDGGPGGGMRRTTDGGKTWTKITSGLPRGDMGKIGLAMAPSMPNRIYAVVEANKKEQGFYRSDNFGVTWKKVGPYVSRGAMYYNEIIVDPKNPNRIYAMDTYPMVSEDAGKTFKRLSAENMHVDHHALFIDPNNTDHLIIGNDGGVYETWDRGQSWRHMRNLPITQFYKISPDNAFPFYSVYGGTQDNYSLGVPIRTTHGHGITNADWTITWGGDGFESVVDPNNANIIYSQSQHGGLGRIDKTTGERLYIAAQPPAGAKGYRWNWNAPLVASSHKEGRIYHAAEKVFRSDDYGNTWTVISPDLTDSTVDRNTLKIMDRVWSVDALAKNASTSIWHSVVSLSESPVDENVMVAGTDDGIIQTTTDGGKTWTKTNIRKVKGVTGLSLIEDVEIGTDGKTIFATADAHKYGDFKPYILKSTDFGKSWKLISNNLPARGTAHTIVQDHIDPNLLFVGTEFGLYFSQNGGGSWSQIKGSFPTIAVRDIDIQARENDLVVASFGRGFWVLDDYSPLRSNANKVAGEKATMFPIKDAWSFFPEQKWGNGRKGFAGADFYSADNPKFGAAISFYLKDGVKTRQQVRQAKEADIKKKGGDNNYPTWDEFKAEDREEVPSLVVTITDNEGKVVRRIKGTVKKGFQRIYWDLRRASDAAIDGRPARRSFFGGGSPMVMEGTYTASMAKRVDGKLVDLGQSQSFQVKRLHKGIFENDDKNQLAAFLDRVSRLSRASNGMGKAMGEINNRIKTVTLALNETPEATEVQHQMIRLLKTRMADLSLYWNGDSTRTSRRESGVVGVGSRLGRIMWGQYGTMSEVTQTNKDQVKIVSDGLVKGLQDLRAIEADLSKFEAEIGAEAPWTPGRIPVWNGR